MDFLSTWVATPNMVLEGNPVAKKLGWKWGIPVNLAFCVGFALLAITSNRDQHDECAGGRAQFSSAWLMRTLGEQATARGISNAFRKPTSPCMYFVCWVKRF